jgi:Mg-chelatase subunit ChlD
MKTHVTFVLDSSGSMSAIEDDTRGGFNSLLEEQRTEEGTATVTLYDFNTAVNRVYRGRPVEEAPRLDRENYRPGGSTALYDAMATAVTETDERLGKIPEDARPDHVVVVILTDGKENASETPRDRVRTLIDRRQEADDWEFLFIGANQDAALTAETMNIDAERSLEMDHSGEGTRAAYESTSRRIREVREEGSTGGFDGADRRRQDEAGDH